MQQASISLDWNTPVATRLSRGDNVASLSSSLVKVTGLGPVGLS